MNHATRDTNEQPNFLADLFNVKRVPERMGPELALVREQRKQSVAPTSEGQGKCAV